MHYLSQTFFDLVLRNLGTRERALLTLYTQCHLGMPPTAFYAKWNVAHALIAAISGCSESTVDSWFQQSKGYQAPEALYQQRLAEMGFFWEHYELSIWA